MTPFATALTAFIAATQEQVNAAHTYDGKLAPYTEKLVAVPGRKYVKIAFADKTTGRPHSVHSFVRIADGAVLKAEGWKKPETKHPRGSIYRNAGQDAVSWTGAHYLVR